jgi:DNA-binding PadR family transcriptional regulator
MTIAEEITSLERQLDQLKHNLLSIREKKVTFIDPQGVPLDLERAELQTQAHIKSINTRLTKLELSHGILSYLCSQASGGRTYISQLCQELDIQTDQDVVFEVLDSLSREKLVDLENAGRQGILIKVTDKGRERVKALREPYVAEDTPKVEPSATCIVKPDTEVVETMVEYSEFSWTLDGLSPQHIYVVQRQDVVDRIHRILEDRNDERIVFLYGPPQVGKTFVLNRLKETLKDQYVPVFIHVNGWLSISLLPKFLYELANAIQYEIESSEPIYKIEPFTLGSDLEATAEFSRFMNNLVQSIRAEGKWLLLMLDELEYLACEETDEHVFEYLAGCIDSYFQQVRFVFAGSGHMLDLLRHGPLATLWARGQTVPICCFDKEISRVLVIAQTDRYFRFEPRALDRVICLADGQPSLLKSVLAIVVRHWRNRWRKPRITEDELSSALEDICIELSPKLTNIWYGLPLFEKRILQQVAQSGKTSFGVNDVALESEVGIKRCLDWLVKQNILHYDLQDRLYTVRLGLLVESISRGILSVSN